MHNHVVSIVNKLKTKETEHKWHWSSTEDSSTFAWGQNVVNGLRASNLSKAGIIWTRAVRKVKK